MKRENSLAKKQIRVTRSQKRMKVLLEFKEALITVARFTENPALDAGYVDLGKQIDLMIIREGRALIGGEMMKITIEGTPPEEKAGPIYEITCPFCEQVHRFVFNESSLGATRKVNPDLTTSGFYVARKVVQN